MGLGSEDATTAGITVRELASLPRLETTVIAGHEGIDRPISWAMVHDDPAPWDWLEPGDLVLTAGLIIPREEQDQIEFVERCNAAGFSGLVIGVEPCPPLHDAMLEKANELAFPVLRAAYSVSMAQHVRAVAAANEGEEHRSLNRIMRVYEEVRASMEKRRTSVELLAALQSVLGCQLFLVDRETWEPLLPETVAPAPEWRSAIDSELAKRNQKIPMMIRASVENQTALAVPVPAGRPVVLLALPNEGQSPKVAVLQQVAAACALEITRVEAGFERDRRSGALVLSEALEGRLSPSIIEAHMNERAITPPYVCFAVETDPQTADRLVSGWAVDGVGYMLSGIGPTFIGVLPALQAEILGPLPVQRQVRIGVSDEFFDLGALGDAARQARWALATLDRVSPGLAHYADDGDLLLPRTLSEAQLVVKRVLQPLLDYDREQGAELTNTLRVYLESDRSPKRTAELLIVHSQTVNYRITRIQELTGRSLRSTNDISELWTGIQALALSETAPRSG